VYQHKLNRPSADRYCWKTVDPEGFNKHLLKIHPMNQGGT
jgi:hypothetical protein